MASASIRLVNTWPQAVFFFSSHAVFFFKSHAVFPLLVRFRQKVVCGPQRQRAKIWSFFLLILLFTSVRAFMDRWLLLWPRSLVSTRCVRFWVSAHPHPSLILRVSLAGPSPLRGVRFFYRFWYTRFSSFLFLWSILVGFLCDFFQGGFLLFSFLFSIFMFIIYIFVFFSFYFILKFQKFQFLLVSNLNKFEFEQNRV
jgi:hypothetical protein